MCALKKPLIKVLGVQGKPDGDILTFEVDSNVTVAMRLSNIEDIKVTLKLNYEEGY